MFFLLPPEKFNYKNCIQSSRQRIRKGKQRCRHQRERKTRREKEAWLTLLLPGDAMILQKARLLIVVFRTCLDARLVSRSRFPWILIAAGAVLVRSGRVVRLRGRWQPTYYYCYTPSLLLAARRFAPWCVWWAREGGKRGLGRGCCRFRGEVVLCLYCPNHVEFS